MPSYRDDGRDTENSLTRCFLEFVNEAKRELRKDHPFSQIPNTTMYSVFMKYHVTQVVEGILRNDTSLRSGITAVFLQGSIAFGTSPAFNQVIEGEKLGRSTCKLISILYSWQFSQIANMGRLSGNRFLTGTYLTPIELLIVYKDDPELARKLDELIRSSFISCLGFSPNWICRYLADGDLDPVTSLASLCIIGQVEISTLFNKPSTFDFVQVRDKVIRCIVAELRTGRLSRSSEYLTARTFGDQFLLENWSLDTLEPLLTSRSITENELIVGSKEWIKNNKEFFHYYQTNRFERILVEDATDDLQDHKGQDKDRKYTILRVLGLLHQGQVIQCHDVMIKLRGLPHYRSELNNIFDLLKEYAVYHFLHESIDSELELIPSVGPVLYSGERLDIPFSAVQKSGMVGYFMEAIGSVETQAILTCRVHNLTNPLWFRNTIDELTQKTKEINPDISETDITQYIASLVSRLWAYGLSIDYCDLVFFLSTSGRIESIRLIDFERLNFAELVGEKHTLLNAIFDIKTRLPKNTWSEILPLLYNSDENDQPYRSLAEISKMLTRTSRIYKISRFLLRLVRDMLIFTLGKPRGEDFMQQWGETLLIRWA